MIKGETEERDFIIKRVPNVFSNMTSDEIEIAHTLKRMIELITDFDKGIEYEIWIDHIAVKYNRKPWLVVKKLRKFLKMFIRVNNETFRDSNLISEPALSQSTADEFGNRFIKLNSLSQLPLIEDLVIQSYSFRTSNDYWLKWDAQISRLR